MPPVVAAVVGVAGLLGVTATQLVVGVLATAARFAFSYYQAQKAKQQKPPKQNIEQNVRQAGFPRYNVLGRARVGGVMFFYEASGGYLYIGTVLADDIIDGVDAFYVNNIECLVDSANYVTTPPFNTKYGKLVRFEMKHGYTDQAASAILQAKFPSAWTADHKLQGIAHMVTELRQPRSEDWQTVYGGTVPPIAALVRGVLAYDPRDEGQDPAQADTWTTTTNPALLLLYYFTATNGMGLSRALFDGDSFSAVADYCDELIATKTKGNRKRYEMGGVYFYDQDPVDIIQAILDTFAGRIFISQTGLFGLSCDDLDTPEITITEDMILEIIDAKRRPGALYEYTTIKTRFTSEDHGYLENAEEADPWTDEDALDLIGREIPYSFDLPYVFRHDQARRLMKKKFFELNPEWSLDLAVDYNGIELFGERVCRIVYAPLGIDGTFRVESVAPDSDAQFARIIVKLSSVPAAASEWDEVEEEGTAPAIAPATAETAAPQTPANLNALVGDTGGNIRALITWTAVTTGKGQEAQFKLTSDTVWTTVAVTADSRDATLTALTSAANYDFRVRVTDARYGVSAWATITFTATAVVGTTSTLQSLTASGGVNQVTVTAQQAADAEAAFIEIAGVADLAAVSWSNSVTVAAKSGATVTVDIDQDDGARDIYARSIGINGDTSTNSGPVSVTVAQQVVDDGGEGNEGGEGGGGKNDGSVAPSQEGDNVSPSQDDSGNDGGGGGFY